ncbi:hypothetical protein W02_05990 [Nitrospira sp. KM1]|uniref:hypothetical protein n=1 Tax=Nitrospira sp. KM1 TaxID=1936990 RepID=UPI0013A76797|nr:hypothetical protein [Nitrospira sp. KM1]BCA53459.1 hypothetical protein W02_05990 [Nitrospira sp. KM1]
MKFNVPGIVACIVALSLAGCGDQGESDSVATTAEGAWSGSTGSGRTLTAAVLSDGTYYFFYSVPGNINQIAGMIQGTGTSTEGRFSSSNAKDINAEGRGALDATISANYDRHQSFSGTVTYVSGGEQSFNSSYNSAYDTTPATSSLAGFYAGQLGTTAGLQSTNITVAADGGFAGSQSNGCTFTGSATPRTRGNVFDQRMTFGPAPCLFAGRTLTGVVMFDVSTLRLYIGAPDSSRTNGVVYSGLRLG